MRGIDGPAGEFWLPSEPEGTSRTCEKLARDVWGDPSSNRPGEYDLPGLPVAGIQSILDIGGNIGAFAVWARARWGSSVQITAYEPFVEAAAYYFRNVPDAVLRVAAVTTSANPTLNVYYPDWGMSTTHYSGSAGSPVRGMHPSNLPAADLLKIDAEGVELEVIENYSHLRDLKVLLYEYHDAGLRDGIRSFLTDVGSMWQASCGTEKQGIDLWLGKQA